MTLKEKRKAIFERNRELNALEAPARAAYVEAALSTIEISFDYSGVYALRNGTGASIRLGTITSDTELRHAVREAVEAGSCEESWTEWFTYRVSPITRS